MSISFESISFGGFFVECAGTAEFLFAGARQIPFTQNCSCTGHHRNRKTEDRCISKNPKKAVHRASVVGQIHPQGGTTSENDP